jgi:uncharacterized circularly permuted ATP-grasp superfamily protein
MAASSFANYSPQAGRYDEVFAMDGRPRPHWKQLVQAAMRARARSQSPMPSAPECWRRRRCWVFCRRFAKRCWAKDLNFLPSPPGGCGEAPALEHAIQRLPELVIKPAFPSMKLEPTFGDLLSD